MRDILETETEDTVVFQKMAKGKSTGLQSSDWAAGGILEASRFVFKPGFEMPGAEAWEMGDSHVQNSGEREIHLSSWFLHLAAEMRPEEKPEKGCAGCRQGTKDRGRRT